MFRKVGKTFVDVAVSGPLDGKPLVRSIINLNIKLREREGADHGRFD